ncbi:MAG: insulinase family protein, partial [Planctomycetes bacterium]|nr:insulinase family protein [Planctomycetota bacterium]
MQKSTFLRPFRTELSLIFLSLLLVISGCEVGGGLGGGVSQQQGERMFDYREIELDNGLKVVTLEDFSCPIVAAQVWYHVGSKDEDPERQGFAHMFEHMMFKGTDRVGPKDHFGFIRRVGGTNNAYTSFDTTVYIQTLPADQLELALWLEAERMTFLKINQDAFDTERKVVEEELRMGENRPYGTLLKRVAGEIFKVHPYQWTPIGNLGHLRSATVGELRDFWERYYVPNNATLVIVGAVEHKEAQDLARKYFGWVPPGADPGRVTIREPETGARKVVFDDENAPTGLAGVGWRTVPLGHPDEVVLDLLSNILGGGNSSRLYRELVAEKRLAVVAMATTWNLEHDGLFVAGALEGPLANADVLLEAIGRHVETLKTEPVSDEELEKARNQMLKSLVTRNLTIGSKARTLGTAAVEKNDTERVNTLLAEIQAVTKDDLMRVANKYLTDDRTLTLIVERNLKGMMAGKKDDEDIAVTAEREETAPPPGREGVTRGDDFPSEAPVAELAASQPMPGYNETKLANGLSVVVVENHEVPFVSVRLGLLSGAWTEAKPGTASMAMQLLTKGTGGHTEAELAEELERYAISLRGSAGMDTASVYANCLTEQLDRAMDLMAEVVLEPAFLKEEFDKLRTQVITGLEIEAKSPRYLADKEFRRLIYGKHPYARTTEGEVSDVKALTARDLKRWWGSFARPDEGTLIFAGDITEERAVE